VQIEQEAGLQSRSGQFAEETISRRCWDSNSGSEIVTEVTMNIPVSFTCQKAVNRSSWRVGTNQAAAALPGQLLCGDRRINGTLSEQRAERITGL